MVIMISSLPGGSGARNGEMTVEEFKKWLKHFDADKDSRISKEEMREAVHYAGKWFGGRRSRHAMRAADGNASGFIEDHEIQKLAELAGKHLGKKINL